MALAVVHYQDLTIEGCGIFTLSSFWGEHWSKSMTQLRHDLTHEFGTEFKLIDMDSLSDAEFEELRSRYVSN